MILSQLQLYQVIETPEVSVEDFDASLRTRLSQPITDYDGQRLGWVAPAGKLNDRLVIELQGHRLCTALLQERLLPNAVIEDHLELALKEFEGKHQRPTSRSEKSRIKEQIVESLLPQAFVRPTRFNLWWNTRKNIIGIETTSKPKAETVLNLLRETLGSLKVIPLRTVTGPHLQFTAWLNDPTSRPSWLSLGEKAKFQAKGGATFNATKADLEGAEVASMLETGHQAIMLACEHETIASFVITRELEMKEIKLKEAVIADGGAHDNEDQIERFESDFVIAAFALQELIELVIHELGGIASNNMAVENPRTAAEMTG